MSSQVVVERGHTPLVSAAAPLALIILSAFAAAAGLWKLLAIGWISFLAMAGCAAVARLVPENALRLVWGYGLTSGAMLASASAFIVPQAINQDPKIGGFGIAAGIIGGFSAHTIGHRLSNASHLNLPFDDTVTRLMAHALAAGLVIGVIYTSLPGLGLILGLGIVSHKGPAGYAAARRLLRSGRPVSVLLFPAAAVGVPAMLVGLFGLSMPAAVSAAFFGFAAGMFIHVAMDFLPQCEAGSEVEEVASSDSTDSSGPLLDRLRSHALVSTAVGGLVVVAAWAALAL